MMKKPLFLTIASLICLAPFYSISTAEAPLTNSLPANPETISSNTVTFTPPPNWNFAEGDKLSKNVKVMVIGKGAYQYPPSINLATEPFKGTLKDYLKIVKNLNKSQGVVWKDLGTIKTDAGNASLSQIEMEAEWGAIKMMHVILVQSGNAYILTAASRKEEFPRFYKDFFASMRSLRIEKNSDANTLNNNS